MTFPLLRSSLGLVASALLATGFVAAAVAPAYAAPISVVAAMGAGAAARTV